MLGSRNLQAKLENNWLLAYVFIGMYNFWRSSSLVVLSLVMGHVADKKNRLANSFLA